MRVVSNSGARTNLGKWLTAGYLEKQVLFATTAGTPQGGIISPLLLNVALPGMEAALGVRHDSQGTSIGKRAVVRYAADFVVFCDSQADALVVREQLVPDWLAKRGL